MKKIAVLFAIISIGFLTANGQSGITWSAPVNVATSASGNEHPRIVLDALGRPLITWHHTARAMFCKWNGSSFTAPVLVNTANMQVAGASWMGPDIASHGDTVYVAYKRMPENSDTNHIYLVHSFNGGTTFSAPSQVDFIGSNFSRFPTVTTDNAGNPMLGFMKFDSNFANAQWAFTKSSDYGSTFSTDVHSSGYSGGNVCDCCPGTILNSGNTVAVLYRDAYNNIRDQWAAISTNSGATFPSGFTVDNTNWLLTSCPGSGPDGVIIGDTVITVYMSGASGTGMAYYSKSSISGAAIGSNQQMTGSFAGLTTQNYPRIANNGNAVAMTWKQAVSGVDQLGLLFTNNINNGFPPLYDTVAINNITNADVAIGNGVIHIVWEDDNAGVIKYRKGTFNTSTTAVPTINGRRLASTIYPNPATDILTISNPNKIENIRIMDAIGNCVLISKDQVLSVKDLADGIYMIQIVTQNSIETKRLEKISK